MVESNKRSGPCDYQFEEIVISRKVYVSKNGAASSSQKETSDLNAEKTQTYR